MSSETFQTIAVERSEGVVTVTMNRPERKNAINDVMFEELADAFGAVATDPDARVLVLTGAGGDFCSGADLSQGPEVPDANGLARMRRVHRLATALHAVPQPTIARIPGVAAGAGLSIALGCDLTLASTEARFSAIFSKRGLATDMGMAWLLPRLIGLHRAKEMALFGDVLPAAEAERLGLVNRVVPPDELDTLVADWAARLAAGPPIALTQIKRAFDRTFESSFASQLEVETTGQALSFTTEDTREAMIAFVEKRTPTFEGR